MASKKQQYMGAGPIDVMAHLKRVQQIKAAFEKEYPAPTSTQGIQRFPANKTGTKLLKYDKAAKSSHRKITNALDKAQTELMVFGQSACFEKPLTTA